jgi:hypothetical protein
MEDPAKVMMVLALLGTVSITVTTIARTRMARGGDSAKRANDSIGPLADDRLARLEQAVDAIALEVERISEGQRFTTKLLSEQSRPAPKPVERHLSTNTPT